ncbi:UbiD family decarboxylase [Amycolatopsis palatopharyngis]|uniref:UbiD family decarboxylase n=1 Tax=Amycolatopsis palatopharyngis TaxID=187982 RepID=UPI000E244A0D|nr:UbiD family decarboxylase [Amycolatopsis palatopharyngis]
MSEREITKLPPGADLRGWLRRLADSGRLTTPQAGLDLRFEVAATANVLDGTAATFFRAPGGSDTPVVSGLLSQRDWMAESMGVPTAEVARAFGAASEHPIDWVEVPDPACQQVVTRDVDLTTQLPIPTHNEHDSGAYITAGLLIARNPVIGQQNVSIHRLQVTAPDKLGVLLLPRHTLAFLDESAAAGVALEIAIVIGVDPLTLMASQAIVPLGVDELTVSGALRGEPLPVTRCVTNEVRVPADAEIVLEGRIEAAERAPEGPFGEFPQYYGERAERHVVTLDAITTREKPIFHTIVGGGLEHLLLGALPREATFLVELQRRFACVRDVHLSRGGTCRYHLYVQVAGHKPGEVTNVILSALSVHYDVKHVVVVDADVDVHDPMEVEWAVATRFQAKRDLLVVNTAQGSKLDPSTVDGVGSKLGMDATSPLDASEMKFLRIRVPGQEDLTVDGIREAADNTPPVDYF